MDYTKLGAIERPKDDRDILLGSVQAPVAAPASFIPEIVWLVRNYQGQTPMCGEHAGTHFKVILDNVATKGSSKGRKSPRYGSIKLKTPGSPVCDGYAIDAGTDMRSIFKWLQALGAADFEPLENDVTLPLAQYCEHSVITSEMDANAAQSKIASYAFGSTDYESLCQSIYQNKAVLLLIKCDDGFWNTTSPTFTEPKYGHFVTAFGYDESGIYVLDSADPSEAFAIKKIAKEYVTPTFILESGTAIDIPPSVKQVLTNATISTTTKQQIVQQIIADIQQALVLVKKEIGEA